MLLSPPTFVEPLFDLDPGIVLVAGETLRARQTDGADQSPLSSVGVSVQDAGPSSPMFELPVVACSDRVVVTGLAPGSTGTVREAGSGVALGSSTGGTREVVTLSGHLGLVDHLVIDATPCGGVPGTRSAEPPIETLRTVAPNDRRLLIVDVVQPLLPCQRLLSVQNAQPGTTFWLERGDGTQVTLALSADHALLRLDPALAEGEKIGWWVEGDRQCEVLPSDRSDAIAVAGPPPAPLITTDACPGSPMPHCGALVPGATVRLRVDGVDALEFEAGAATRTSTSAGCRSWRVSGSSRCDASATTGARRRRRWSSRRRGTSSRPSSSRSPIAPPSSSSTASHPVRWCLSARNSARASSVARSSRTRRRGVGGAVSAERRHH